MRFADPWFLLLLALPAALLFLTRSRIHTAIPYGSIALIADLPRSMRQRLLWLPNALFLAAVALIIVALARPQYGVLVSTIEREGIAIGLVVDASTSMSALDLELDGERRDRLVVAKDAITRFVNGDSDQTEGREGDEIAVVSFARFATSVSPLTLDHDAVLGLLDSVEIIDNPEDDGTAIGDAMMLAVETLRAHSEAGKVIILLTDGSHNAGETEPVAAAEVAKAMGIKVYTIGAGTKGLAMMPSPNRQGGIDYLPTQVFIDEFVLEKVAEITEARFFRATDSDALRQIYTEIDRLEKGRNVISYHQLYRDVFWVFGLGALCLMAIGAGLSATWLRVAP